MGEKPKPEQDKKTGRFVSGNIGGGRPKGSRNLLGEAFLSDMLDDWKVHGTKVIEAVRAEKPDQYLKVVASILPKELNIRAGEFDDLTDDELARELANISAQLAAIESGDNAGATGKKANRRSAAKPPRVH